jgi:hypothetical protein
VWVAAAKSSAAFFVIGLWIFLMDMPCVIKVDRFFVGSSVSFFPADVSAFHLSKNLTNFWYQNLSTDI